MRQSAKGKPASPTASTAPFLPQADDGFSRPRLWGSQSAPLQYQYVVRYDLTVRVCAQELSLTTRSPRSFLSFVPHFDLSRLRRLNPAPTSTIPPAGALLSSARVSAASRASRSSSSPPSSSPALVERLARRARFARIRSVRRLLSARPRTSVTSEPRNSRLGNRSAAHSSAAATSMLSSPPLPLADYAARSTRPAAPRVGRRAC